jgi:hypothetical protein
MCLEFLNEELVLKNKEALLRFKVKEIMMGVIRNFRTVMLLRKS